MTKHQKTDAIDRRLCVAPMMDWTDRHCRVFHRHLAPNALLFTEMVTADAIIHGDLERLLGHDLIEHPLVLQLGGSQPERLALAVQRAAEWGFAEINLNVGCPSDRVQSGRFGACLMAEPELVAECCAAMMAASALPITVKCRIGIDDMDAEAGLDRFIDLVAWAGVGVFYLHARKAWLKGLSPKENRNIPPLDYDRARRLASRRDDLAIILNGGLETTDQIAVERDGFAGVMLGRAAYRTPYLLTAIADDFFAATPPSRQQVAKAMADYADKMTANNVPLHSITRHMLGLYAGQRGAKHWRRQLGEQARFAQDGGGFIRQTVEECEILAARLAA
ncbi:MAG: tRNA dihydrouridine(20/20a) synthase DusA [Proteobacteria bacterium]|nr:tRNA dihydrouridine(20/20a) synthase DusA [Pseudomonadota bacterium]MDA1151710.1 tRNA dihydrouridine(20/20a) synthase DusA [Pseudomonadota bacterium]